MNDNEGTNMHVVGIQTNGILTDLPPDFSKEHPSSRPVDTSSKLSEFLTLMRKHGWRYVGAVPAPSSFQKSGIEMLFVFELV